MRVFSIRTAVVYVLPGADRFSGFQCDLCQSTNTLKELLALPDRSGQGEASDMRRAIIMSGFTQKELHKLMTAYRLAELPSQLWATLTPISENWSVTNLLEELAAESEAIKKQKEGSTRPTHT